jgi:protein disulfide-isomerase A1
MIKQSLPAVSTLTSETLEEFKTADKVVLVAYIDADDKASNETFTAVANDLRDSFLFGATNDASLAKAEGVTAPAIVLYKQFDEGKDTFTDKFDKEAIEKFAKTASIPLVGEVGPETYAGYIAVSGARRFSMQFLTFLNRPAFLLHISSPRLLKSVRS